METVRERREYLRADLNVFVNTAGPGGMLLARATDISERGVRFVLPANPVRPPCRKLSVEFCLPGEEIPLKALGRVVHEFSDPNLQGAAIEFCRLNTRDATRIRQYVIRRKRAEIFEQLRQAHLGLNPAGQ